MHSEPVRILQIESGCNAFSGVSSYLLKQYSAMDRRKIHYDFLYVKHNSIAALKNESVLAGSEVYSLDARNKKNGRTVFSKIIGRLRNIFKENRYDAIVVDSSNIVIAFACWIAVFGIRDLCFIAHAHMSGIIADPHSIRGRHPLLMKCIDHVSRLTIRRNADWLFACTEMAGRFTFGQKALRQDNFRIVHNAIDLESFRPNPEVRGSTRKENGITGNTAVFGYAGRMATGKNLDFLISVFAELHRRNVDSVLWMVGDGDERKKLQARAEALGLENSVVFFGQRPDVNRLMQGMDGFIFPSLMEGLGMVAIEAQASGLPTVVSDGVPDDVLITPLIRKVSLKASASEWADAVLAQMDRCPERKAYSEELAQAGYDVREEAKKMMDFYEWIVEQKKLNRREKREERIVTEMELDSAGSASVHSR